MKTIQNNNLIAEYLGLQTGSNIGYDRWKSDWFDNRCLINGQRNETLQFDTDWNWLMEVVEKIEMHGFNFEIKKNWARISRKGENIVLRWEEDKNKIKAVYNACVEFINWYNKQK